jgi:hypothetical protein
MAMLRQLHDSKEQSELYGILETFANFLLNQVAAEEGHYAQPRGTGDPDKQDRASRFRHCSRRKRAARDPECDPQKRTKSVNANRDLRKSTIDLFALHFDATDKSEGV